ncbi:MAG: heparan-alpha-glucosaminide N-acetyltransferase domain-containing protein [Ferruginibacter sp.]
MQNKRLKSLDAFRGFTVAAMIMVNFPGDGGNVFFTLKHTVWNGLSFTDLVAPFFLFIVGVSTSFAFAKTVREKLDKKAAYKKIIIRSLKIYALGMFLNMMPFFNLHEIRWTGTLHRIAIVFMVCSFIYLNTNWKQQAFILISILIGYWIVILGIPTPGLGKVVMEPGKNLAAWVDSIYMPGKLWQGTWDPEGILSTFPSIATCITGMLAGKLLQTSLPENVKINYLVSFGVVLAVLGYFVGLAFPVNENLWTSSFVLITSGFSALALGVLYFRLDILEKVKGSLVGVVFGANAITAYALGDILSLFFYSIKFGNHSLNEHVVNTLTSILIAPKLASLIYALFFVSVVFIPVYILYKKKIFIKI